jgi:AraC-like DNA-binding protein
MEAHTHDDIEIMYAVKGRCIVQVEAESFPMRDGDYIFIDSNVPHSLFVERDCPCQVLNLELLLTDKTNSMRLESLAQEVNFLRFLEAKPQSFLCRDRDGVVHNGIISLHRLLGRKCTAMELDMQLSLILLEIGHQFADKQKKRSTGMPAYIKRSFEFIVENFDQSINSADIAAAACVSKSHLQRTFHKYMGCTIVEAVNRLRLDKAKFLLRTSAIPVVDVAAEVGFSSRQYFSELFTRSTGRTPANYRKRCAENVSSGHEDFVQMESL